MNKPELRKAIRQKRAKIPADTRLSLSNQICNFVKETPEFQSSDAVLFYIPTKEEVNILPLLQAARAMGKTVAIPRCNPDVCRMDFFIVREGDTLVPGAYGIPEPPKDAPLFSPTENTLCLVPALSFDLYGNRLGNGKGYYDRYLAKFQGKVIGVSFRELMVRELPSTKDDIPVSVLVTEAGIMPLLPPKPQREKLSFSKGNRPTAKETATAFWEWLKKLFRKDPAAPPPPWRLPWVIMVIFAKLAISVFFERALLTRTNEYVGFALIQCMVFGIPTCTHLFVRGKKFRKKIRIHLFRPGHIPLIFYLLVLMISGSLLFSILFHGMDALTGNFTLYETFTSHVGGGAWDAILCALVYGVMPALFEESIFRALLCAEYEKFGVWTAVIVSSFLYAMLHFSLPLFFAYFFLGVLLALSMYATRSAVTPVILHLLFNLFCLFARPYLSAFYLYAGSTDTFLFLLVTVFLLFAAFSVGKARKIYHIYAKLDVKSSYAPKIPLKRVPGITLTSMYSPCIAGCILIWLGMSIYNLF